MDTKTAANQSLETMLRESLWASALIPDELDQVVRESHERRLAPGGHAVRNGENADCWIGVIEGLVKMSVSHRRRPPFDLHRRHRRRLVRRRLAAQDPAAGATTASRSETPVSPAYRAMFSSGWSRPACRSTASCCRS